MLLFWKRTTVTSGGANFRASSWPRRCRLPQRRSPILATTARCSFDVPPSRHSTMTTTTTTASWTCWTTTWRWSCVSPRQTRRHGNASPLRFTDAFFFSQNTDDMPQGMADLLTAPLVADGFGEGSVSDWSKRMFSILECVERIRIVVGNIYLDIKESDENSSEFPVMLQFLCHIIYVVFNSSQV